MAKAKSVAPVKRGNPSIQGICFICGKTPCSKGKWLCTNTTEPKGECLDQLGGTYEEAFAEEREKHIHWTSCQKDSCEECDLIYSQKPFLPIENQDAEI